MPIDVLLAHNKLMLLSDCDLDISCLNINTHETHGTWYASIHLSQEIANALGIPTHADIGKNVRLHRIILERMLGRSLDSDEQVDHANHDGLDNRRENLRLASNTENHRNLKKESTPTTSKYRGVSKTPGQHWMADIRTPDHIHLGIYKTEEEAALAYDNAARTYFKEFANLNFPDRHEIPTRLLAPTKRSHFRGVWLNQGRWGAQININKKRTYLGGFATEEEAARAYDVEARKIGRKTNFPEPMEMT